MNSSDTFAFVREVLFLFNLNSLINKFALRSSIIYFNGWTQIQSEEDILYILMVLLLQNSKDISSLLSLLGIAIEMAPEQLFVEKFGLPDVFSLLSIADVLLKLTIFERVQGCISQEQSKQIFENILNDFDKYSLEQQTIVLESKLFVDYIKRNPVYQFFMKLGALKIIDQDYARYLINSSLDVTIFNYGESHGFFIIFDGKIMMNERQFNQEILMKYSLSQSLNETDSRIFVYIIRSMNSVFFTQSLLDSILGNSIIFRNIEKLTVFSHIKLNDVAFWGRLKESIEKTHRPMDFFYISLHYSTRNQKTVHFETFMQE